MSTHNKLLFLVISIFSLIIFGCETTPEVKAKPEEKPQPTEYEAKFQRGIEGGLNKEQPISIGEVIYVQEAPAGGYMFRASETTVLLLCYRHTVSYRYMGVDYKNNIIKVTYSYVIYRPYEKPVVVETLDLSLPLNPKKQTILKVKSFEGPAECTLLTVKSLESFEGPERTLVSKKELLITVIDEFSRITVEEIIKNQTK